MVHIQYCDGSSYSGNKSIASGVGTRFALRVPCSHAVPWAEDQIFYRGHAVLEAILDELTHDLGMGGALRVMLTGCSAGALGVYLHADRIRDEYLLDVLEFDAVPSAGLFLWETSLAGTKVYENKMRAVHKLHEAVVNCECAEVASFIT